MQDCDFLFEQERHPSYTKLTMVTETECTGEHHIMPDNGNWCLSPGSSSAETQVYILIICNNIFLCFLPPFFPPFFPSFLLMPYCMLCSDNFAWIFNLNYGIHNLKCFSGQLP